MSRGPAQWRGSVLAEGLLYELSLVPLAEARRRIMALAVALAEPGQTFEVRVLGDAEFLIALFPRAVRVSCATAGGAPLVRDAHLWSTCAFDDAARASLPNARDHVVRLVGGRLLVTAFAELAAHDVAGWVDLTHVELLEVSPLGAPLAAPTARAVAATATVREVFDMPLSAEAHEATRELRARLHGEAPSRAATSTAVLVWVRALGARLLHAAAHLFRSLLARSDNATGGRRLSVRASAGHEEAAGDGEADSQTPAPASWWRRLRAGAHALAARTVLQTRLARFVGRRHARYLSRLLQMFDDNRLDEALRHAIPIGGEAGAMTPALTSPGPRESLALQLTDSQGAATGIAVEDDVLEILRQRYRRAFERLHAKGEIEKAAFVLAELLHADAEAVQFLERNGRLRLAAELAEARKMPPGLVIRQWVLAKDPARALMVARRTGAFADAVTRLAATHPAAANELRLLWAEQLAAAGAYAAAVDICWSVPGAEAQLASWIDHAISVGGPTGARMVIRKVKRFPSAFAEARASVLALLERASQDPESITACVSMAEELAARAPSPELAALARPVLRYFLAAPERPQLGSAKRNVELPRRLLEAADDPVLRADVQAAWGLEARGRSGVAVSARALAQHGDGAIASFLDRAVTAKEQRNRLLVIEGDAAMRGVFLAVTCGSFAGSPPEINATAARELETAVQAALAEARPDPASRSAALVSALRSVNAAWHHTAASKESRRCLTTLAVNAGGTLLIANVGTARAYLLRLGELTRLTRDDTLREEIAAKRREKGTPMSDAELAAFPHQDVLTRVVGATATLEVAVTELPLCQGDLVILCTQPLWRAVPERDLRHIVADDPTPRRATENLLRAAIAAGQPRGAVVIASFGGPALRSPQLETTPPRRFVALDHPTASPPRVEPLTKRDTPIVKQWSAQERGSSHVRDAALLPDGRLVLALGELGACVLGRDGRVSARFGEPAYWLVVSENGDRAIAVAPRGEVRRLSKLDFVRKRAESWCDVTIDAFASTYDGETWFVARGSTVYAVSATAARWEHAWKVTHRRNALHIARDSKALAVWFGDEIWSYELPSLALRSRAPLDLGPQDIVSGAVAPSGLFAGWIHPPDEPPTLRRRPIGGRTGELETLSFPLEDPTNRQPADLTKALAYVRTPVAANAWLAASVALTGGCTVHLYQGSQTDPRVILRFAGEGCRTGTRFDQDRALIFDSFGRVVVLSLETGEILREQIV